MKADELKKILEKIGYYVAYKSLKKQRALPYIIFYHTGIDTYSADNIVYFKQNHYNIELYTKEKNTVLEEKIEQILTDNEIFYNKSEDIFIDSEDLMEVIYYI